MAEGFDVVAGAGSLRSSSTDAVTFPHRWTAEGVSVEGAFTGAHLLHLSVAGCVLNDLYRESQKMGLTLAGVRVSAGGGFDTESWESSGITYSVHIDSDASPEELSRLLDLVDDLAEIPRAVRAGASVERRD